MDHKRKSEKFYAYKHKIKINVYTQPEKKYTITDWFFHRHSVWKLNKTKNIANITDKQLYINQKIKTFKICCCI